jgi:BirA family transcriptional regulator, biotin operon repressor / biotin---[acetyl-CoA-carboxylase] ligase
VTNRDHVPADWQPPASWRRLEFPDAGGSPWHVWRVDETGSTNTDLLDAAAAGAPDRTVLATAHQTAGRGRLDRRWEAPPGTNLLVSLLLRAVPEPASDLTRRVGLAAVDAARDVAGADVRLKWPNDLLLDGRKLAGILAQRSPDGPVVVGIGCNVGWAPDGAACLHEVDPGVSVDDLLRALLAAYDRLPDDIHARYVEALDTLGRSVRCELPHDTIEGRAVDVERDGRLVVLDACAVTHRIDAGDVFLRDE